ncbi:hypothetical protein [Bacteroides graminisolvens]|uniref:hypothetical protein n=1 Tax=Bacteroides graminisolvens TaxID=477666 RepID=UPI00240A4CD1|nr:hypothetical protein [Bacteroides graminisolvens]
MKAILNTFKAGKGDCIFFQLVSEFSRYVIMIDCGSYTAEIKQFVESTLCKHIDLLIITHIDNDHIDGLRSMLQQNSELRIDKIFYNCYQKLTGQHVQIMTEETKSDIERLSQNLPSMAQIKNGKINAEKASTLASLVLSNNDWNAGWYKEDYITINSTDYVLGENFGKLIFLSPRKEDVEMLDKQFAREYMRLTHHTLIGLPFSGQETLYELVSRLVAMKHQEYELHHPKKSSYSGTLFSDNQLTNAYDFVPTTITDENIASIAFIWEGGDKKVLFMGDAEPMIVEQSIALKMGSNKLDFAAIKVSHHGSKHSTSVDLMNLVDSENYFITGGNAKDKPSLEAIVKIINRGDNRKRTLHGNYEYNQLMNKLASEEGTTLREKYNFTISNQNELEFEY